MQCLWQDKCATCEKYVTYITKMYCYFTSGAKKVIIIYHPQAKTLPKPDPVQTGIKLCPQAIPVYIQVAL